MRKKAIIIAIVSMLLLLSTISFSVSSVTTNVQKKHSEDEPGFTLITSSLSVDLAVKKPDDSTWKNSVSAKIGTKLDFKISIFTSGVGMIVAIELPKIDDDLMLDFVPLSASSIPLVTEDVAIVWAFIGIPPEEITFKAKIKKTGTGSVGLTVASTGDSDLVEEDSVQISGKDKSRGFSDLESSFIRINTILNGFKSSLFKILYNNKLNNYIIHAYNLNI